MKDFIENSLNDIIENIEDGLKMGIQIWDLSAAYYTLDIELFVKN